MELQVGCQCEYVFNEVQIGVMMKNCKKDEFDFSGYASTLMKFTLFDITCMFTVPCLEVRQTVRFGDVNNANVETNQ